MGFHLWGLAVACIILLPNLFFFLFPPKNMPEQPGKEPLGLTILENAGRIACLAYPLVFGRDIAAAGAAAPLYVLIACAALYYACWARYFMGGRQYALLFRPLWKIPIPMALFPAVYFLSLAVLLKSLPMGLAALIFTAGHIPISWLGYQRIKNKGRA